MSDDPESSEGTVKGIVLNASDRELVWMSARLLIAQAPGQERMNAADSHSENGGLSDPRNQGQLGRPCRFFKTGYATGLRNEKHGHIRDSLCANLDSRVPRAPYMLDDLRRRVRLPS